MYIQSSIQANGCFSRWSDISSTSPILVGTGFKDTNRICIPYVLSQNFFWWSLNDLLLEYKRGKAIPYLGAFHGSDISEFFGSGVAPDFIGTDALGIFSNLFIVACADTHIQLTLPILAIPLFHRTLKASSAAWTGSHGTRPLNIPFWRSWTPLRMLASRSTPTG